MTDTFCTGTNGGWKKSPASPVLGGDLGVCFDISMLREDDKFRMYFSWRTQKSVAVTESTDGIHWSKPEICVAPKARPDGKEDLINRPAVVRHGDTYHMWYTGQYLPNMQHNGTSDIFHAESTDGVHFRRTGDNPVFSSELSWELNNIMCPCVLWDEEKQVYRMWYSAGEQYEPNAIGYAESKDGLSWKRIYDEPVFKADPSSNWECHKVTACQVFRYGEYYWMFYIGFKNEDYAQIGIARSKDGITGWERSGLNPIVAPDPEAWDGEACYKPFVLRDGKTWKLWYNGRKGSVEQIGLVTNESEMFDF